MNRFKELKVWQESIELASLVYKITSSFPETEKFGLTSQMRRYSVSVSSNIAEGAGRNSPKEFSQFLSISMGSCFELESQLIISRNLDFINHSEFNELQPTIHKIQNMIFKLKQSLTQ